jgi:hypothetical protein
LINVRYYIYKKSKLYLLLKEEITNYNKNKKKEDYFLKISETLFRNYLKQNKIYKESKKRLDCCPTCISFNRKKKLNEEEKKIFENHLKIKDEILNNFKKSKIENKDEEISFVIDFKENFKLNQGNIIINNQIFQNQQNHFNYSSI